ncbi:MAG TPA: copper chaperone PCu(A)C [Burkholderiales bacterium]|nr:copper chaperone PCu(A)C [Burkholderiales bacterium]
MGRLGGWFSALLLMAAMNGQADADGVTVSNAWARATAPGQKVAGVYLDIVSGTDAKLTGVQSPLAARGELHSMRMDNGTMHMRAVEAIDLPAGKAVHLKPGDLHAMLFDLKQALAPGDKLPITLIVVDARGIRHAIAASVQVRNLDGSEPHAHH